jgi:hypothetical protein
MARKPDEELQCAPRRGFLNNLASQFGGLVRNTMKTEKKG